MVEKTMSKKSLLLLIKIIRIKLQILLLKQKLTVPNLPKPKKIILHHGGGWMDFKGVNNYHKYKWGFKSSLGFYIGYQYFIERDGSIHQGRADNEEGAHTKGHNKDSIGICLMGNGVERDFTSKQYQALKSLLDKKRKKYNITLLDIKAHRDYSSTLCPSDKLYGWLRQYKNYG